jgi:hypothetical protein
MTKKIKFNTKAWNTFKDGFVKYVPLGASINALAQGKGITGAMSASIGTTLGGVGTLLFGTSFSWTSPIVIITIIIVIIILFFIIKFILGFLK